MSIFEKDYAVDIDGIVFDSIQTAISYITENYKNYVPYSDYAELIAVEDDNANNSIDITFRLEDDEDDEEGRIETIAYKFVTIITELSMNSLYGRLASR